MRNKQSFFAFRHVGWGIIALCSFFILSSCQTIAPLETEEIKIFERTRVENFINDLPTYRGSYVLFVRKSPDGQVSALASDEMHQLIAYHLSDYGFPLAQKNQIPKYKVIVDYKKSYQQVYSKKTIFQRVLKKQGFIEGITGGGDSFRGKVIWEPNSTKGQFVGHLDDARAIEGALYFVESSKQGYGQFYAALSSGNSWSGRVYTPVQYENEGYMTLSLSGNKDLFGRFSATVTAYFDDFVAISAPLETQKLESLSHIFTFDIYPFNANVGARSQKLFSGRVVYKGNDIDDQKLLKMMIRAMLHQFPGSTQRTEKVKVTNHNTPIEVLGSFLEN